LLFTGARGFQFNRNASRVKIITVQSRIGLACVWYLLFASLLALVVQGHANASGKAVFEERCKSCHDLPDPNKPPEMGWEERLKLMAKVAKLTPEQKAEVLSYLQSHTSKAESTMSLAQEGRLFEEKCSRCHTLDRIFLIPLNDESRKHILKRMRSKAPGWISDSDADLILDYLSKAPRVERDKKAKNKVDEIFIERCSACHSLDRVYDKLKDDDNPPSWAHIVQRMQSKAPQWLSEDEANKVVEYLRSLNPVPNE
jgi:mono/diheme cytochrome c family protein